MIASEAIPLLEKFKQHPVNVAFDISSSSPEEIEDLMKSIKKEGFFSMLMEQSLGLQLVVVENVNY